MENIKKYLKHLKLEGKASNTLVTYSFHLKKYYIWLKKNRLILEEVKPTDLIEFKNLMLQEGKTERTVNAVISCVRGYYDYLIMKEVLQFNPVSEKLHMQVKNIITNPLTEEEEAILHSHISGWKENIQAAYHLMISTGARVGEAAKLLKGDFMITKGRLCIDIKDAKWGSDRVIPVMNKKSAEIIKRYIDSLDIYSKPAFRVSKRTLQTYAENFKKETGINFHCHVLRHTFASRLLEKGIQIEKIQYLLGHKSYTMTRHYTAGANIDVLEMAPSID